MTDKDIIIALGDNRGLADTLGIPKSTVANWKERGIPWHKRGEIQALARRKRVRLPMDFLSQKVFLVEAGK